MTSAAFGLETTLYHFWVNIDPANTATVAQRAAYGTAGPIASLLLGVGAWLVYRIRPQSAAAMPLLLLAAIGIGNFFGNLMSTAFIGDFSNVARWLGLPMGARYAVSIVGVIASAAVPFLAGRELAQWTPAHASRMSAAFTAVVLPVLMGTVIIILVNQPIPFVGFAEFAVARAAESGFWLFAAAGLITAARTSTHNGTMLRLRWHDGAVAALTVATVRVMALGIPLS